MEKIYLFSETTIKFIDGEVIVVDGKEKVLNQLPATRTKKVMLDQVDELMERRQKELEKNAISYHVTNRAFSEPTSKGVVFSTHFVVSKKGETQMIYNGAVIELDFINE